MGWVAGEGVGPSQAAVLVRSQLLSVSYGMLSTNQGSCNHVGLLHYPGHPTSLVAPPVGVTSCSHWPRALQGTLTRQAATRHLNILPPSTTLYQHITQPPACCTHYKVCVVAGPLPVAGHLARSPTAASYCRSPLGRCSTTHGRQQNCTTKQHPPPCTCAAAAPMCASGLLMQASCCQAYNPYTRCLPGVRVGCTCHPAMAGS